MSPSREWWIYPEEPYDSHVWDKPDDLGIHVIEKTPHVSKCLSMHDELLSALKEALPLIEDKSFGFIGEAFAQHCRNVLAKAESE